MATIGATRARVLKASDRLVTVTTWRSDGWPLCPLCGDDELYSLEELASAATVCACYWCGPLRLANPDPPPRAA